MKVRYTVEDSELQLVQLSPISIPLSPAVRINQVCHPPAAAKTTTKDIYNGRAPGAGKSGAVRLDTTRVGAVWMIPRAKQGFIVASCLLFVFSRGCMA